MCTMLDGINKDLQTTRRDTRNIQMLIVPVSEAVIIICIDIHNGSVMLVVTVSFYGRIPRWAEAV